MKKLFDDLILQGYGPLMTAMATVVVTQAFSILAIYIQSRRHFFQQINMSKIDRLRKMSVEFYNPLLTYFKINEELFKKVGPPSFPLDGRQREAAAKVWQHFREEVFKNNLRIRETLMLKSDLIHSSDSIENYLQLQLHILSYETFGKMPNDVHRKFFYPSKIALHVGSVHKVVVDELRKLERSN
jgi:hypothetical protein